MDDMKHLINLQYAPNMWSISEVAGTLGISFNQLSPLTGVADTDQPGYADRLLVLGRKGNFNKLA
jgi:hypothetical protein